MHHSSGSPPLAFLFAQKQHTEPGAQENGNTRVDGEGAVNHKERPPEYWRNHASSAATEMSRESIW